MNSGVKVTLCCLGVLVCFPRSFGQVSRHDNGENAAVKYLRADAALRQSQAFPPDAWVSLERALAEPLNADDEKIVAASASALREFEHAANTEACDWQMSVQDGPLTNTAHRGAMRELVAVVLLRARLRFRERQNAAAVIDVLAALTAARHLSFDGSIASVLFGYKLEREVSEVLTKGINSFQQRELEQLAAGLQMLPHSVSMHDAIQSEKLARNDLLEIAHRASTRNDLIHEMAEGIPRLQGNEKQASDIVDGCGGSLQGVMACIEEQSKFYKKWTSRFLLTPQRFQEQYEADFREASRQNALIAMFTPSLAALKWAEVYNTTERALIQAAVAVKRNGKGELTLYPDPYDGQPFSYSVVLGGFRLESRLKQNGKPLVITIE